MCVRGRLTLCGCEFYRGEEGGMGDTWTVGPDVGIREGDEIEEGYGYSLRMRLDRWRRGG